MGTSDESDSQRPSIGAALSSPTVLLNLSAACVMIACLFFPHSLGTDGQWHRPTSVISTISTTNSSEAFVRASIVLWPYGFAVATCGLMLGLALIRPATVVHVLLAFPICFAALMALCWLVYLFSGIHGSRVAMVMAAVVAPFACCVAARMIWLCRLGHVASAATWGQSLICMLATFSLRWFWIPPVERLGWGGWLSIASALSMMMASWTWGTRSRYDLLDRSVPPLRFQVSLRQIIIAVTVAAVMLTYWQAFSSWQAD